MANFALFCFSNWFEDDDDDGETLLFWPIFFLLINSWMNATILQR